ncbi:MAG: hypothetical protein ACR652_26140 [Methylocystis sp.]|uniref:hypothetical protein n=1 Tax=Methylocystis sp. TaxID=1911079 RepID=UPI003DA3FE72
MAKSQKPIPYASMRLAKAAYLAGAGHSAAEIGAATGMKTGHVYWLLFRTKLKETGERLAGMHLGEDGLLAAAILMRIAANYERAREVADFEFLLGNGEGPEVRLRKAKPAGPAPDLSEGDGQ